MFPGVFVAGAAEQNVRLQTSFMRVVAYLPVIISLGFPLASYAAFPGCPAAIQNSHECAKYLENALGRDRPGLFTRKDGQLGIRIGNGKLKTYTDGKQKVGDETHFNIIQYFPSASLAVIHAQYWEGDTHYVLNLNNGLETHIEGYPILSPDKNRIAVYAFDIVANYGPNVLAVYLIKKENLQLEFIAKPTDWGPTKVRWLDSKRLSFAKTWYDSNMNERTELKSIRNQPNAKEPDQRWVVE
jgi:hypothetical protein